MDWASTSLGPGRVHLNQNLQDTPGGLGGVRSVRVGLSLNDNFALAKFSRNQSLDTLTYVATAEVWRYLAGILDLFKRVRGLDAEWKLLRRPAEHNQVDVRP